jgi:hypothetical protein
MKRAEGATPSRLFKMPRFAEIRAKGIMSLTIRRAPCENGSKTGTKRLTDSSENAETAAILPVLKKADWRRVRKKREMRASVNVRERNGEDESEAGTTGFPFEVIDIGWEATKMLCSSRTQVISVMENPR